MIARHYGPLMGKRALCEKWQCEGLMLSNCGAGEDLEKTPESPLNIKETKPVTPKGNRS